MGPAETLKNRQSKLACRRLVENVSIGRMPNQLVSLSGYEPGPMEEAGSH